MIGALITAHFTMCQQLNSTRGGNVVARMSKLT